MITEYFNLRGFGVSANDIAYNGLYGMIPYYRATAELAERVEVLKGPSALLNGMPPGGSVGGSVNVVPKRAGDKPLARVTGTYASDAQFGVHVDVGQRFGDEKLFGIRFNGVYRDGDTSVNDQSKRTKLAALGLDWRTQRVRLSADFYTSEDHLNGLNRGVSLAPGLGVPSRPRPTPCWPPTGPSPIPRTTPSCCAARWTSPITSPPTPPGGTAKPISSRWLLRPTPSSTSAATTATTSPSSASSFPRIPRKSAPGRASGRWAWATNWR